MKSSGGAETTPEASLKDRLFVAFQLLLPTRWLSTLIHRLTRITNPTIKRWTIRLFMRGFDIDLSEAEYVQPDLYDSFNHFFTRALQPGRRPLPEDPRAFVSPVDGTLSQFGEIRDGHIVQAKGHEYTVLDLLGGDRELAEFFMQGRFCTIYLAPYNYHRIHMPFGGQLRKWSYVPGRLFSVNAATARALPGLFVRNERVNSVFDAGDKPFALVMVGALFVGSMETTWAGRISPPHLRGDPAHYQPMTPTKLARGEELGRFNMGSTVILLAPPGAVDWADNLAPGKTVRMGESLGLWHGNEAASGN